jgi:predicted flap endonuclease-1-like 5' DNA nuclease
MTFDSQTILIVVAILAVLILAFVALRGRGGAPKIERRDGEPYVASKERPYMKPPAADRDGPQGNSVIDEAAVATTDVAGEVLGVKASHAPAGPADELTRLKGVGPKFAARLNELGVTRYDQLAGLNANEVAHLDERMGPFQGRLARDQVIEQADLLARGDTESFEERFGKLTP